MQSILEVNLYHVDYPSKNLCNENYESCLHNTKVINKLSDVSLQIIGLSELADFFNKTVNFSFHMVYTSNSRHLRLKFKRKA